MTDVQPLVGAALARLPAAWTADAIQPDPGALAAWMQRVLEANPLKLTRAAGKAPDVYDRAVSLLASLGVDVPRELERQAAAHEAGKHQTRAAADRIRDLALDLKAADRALLAEARGLNAGAQGFTRATLAEAEGRAARLTAALEEACQHDRALLREVRQQVA